MLAKATSLSAPATKKMKKTNFDNYNARHQYCTVNGQGRSVVPLRHKVMVVVFNFTNSLYFAQHAFYFRPSHDKKSITEHIHFV